VYAHYLTNSDFKEEFLILLPFHNRATGQILFEYFQEFIKNNGLLYQKIISISTDGAPAMIGKANDFMTLLK